MFGIKPLPLLPIFDKSMDCQGILSTQLGILNVAIFHLIYLSKYI